MLHIFGNNFSHFFGNQGNMGGEHGIFNDRCIPGEKGGEGNQQHRGNQYPFDNAESGSANAINPAQKGDIKDMFDDHAQDTDDD